MQVWNMLHAARWKYRMHKIAKNSPSGHHHTTLLGYIFATKARINNPKKNLWNIDISSRCRHNMANFSPLTTEIGLLVWGTPANFNRFRVLPSLLQRCCSPEANQTLHNVWWSPVRVHYIYIFGGFYHLMEFCHVQNSLIVPVLRCRILAASLHGTPADGRQPNFAAWYKEWNYGTFTEGATWAAIMLGIGPHSSF